MNKFKFNEPAWVADFRKFLGLEVCLVEIRQGASKDYYEYDVISPTGEVLFFCW